MRYENISQAKLLSQISKQVNDLSLNRNIQCGDRLVRNHKLRGQGQSPGNIDSLSLTAGKLVRISGKSGNRKPNQIHQFCEPRLNGWPTSFAAIFITMDA
ncbi:hypothetical protein AA21952_1500 [Acetobacter oeni LMG 21952]|nr:hypothetical protein AA21952_1500 [Acetobacter oeni LMG 21952]